MSALPCRESAIAGTLPYPCARVATREFSQEVLTAYQDTFYDRSGYVRSWPLGRRERALMARRPDRASLAKRPLYPLLLVRQR